MSEDEAFIRAIVASPGDDLPRLVYADWLDERSDPRGPYLRAEVEWAKSRQDVGWAPPTADEQERWAVPTLRQMASRLDPMWVARVSRPPMGVCCDHLARAMSDDDGPQRQHADFQIEDEDGEPIESAVGWNFPIPFQYIAFLLNQNGFGVVSDVCFSSGNLRDQLWLDEFNCVFGPNRNESSLLGSVEIDTDPFNPGSYLISIASIFDRHESPSSLLLGTHENSSNRVFVWNCFADHDDVDINQENLIQVADSLGEFLSLLQIAKIPRR